MGTITTLTPEAHPGADRAAAGDSAALLNEPTSLPGLPAYDCYGREITDPALADCEVPNSALMALAWAHGEIDALSEVVARDWFVFTRENVADCLRHVLAGMEARS